MQRATEQPPPARQGLIRRILLGEVQAAANPQPVLNQPPQPGHSGASPQPPRTSPVARIDAQEFIDVRPITEPDLSMIYFRLERLETGVRLIADTMKRACAEILQAVATSREENAARPSAGEVELAVRRGVEPLAESIQKVARSPAAPPASGELAATVREALLPLEDSIRRIAQPAEALDPSELAATIREALLPLEASIRRMARPAEAPDPGEFAGVVREALDPLEGSVAKLTGTPSGPSATTVEWIVRQAMEPLEASVSKLADEVRASARRHDRGSAPPLVHYSTFPGAEAAQRLLWAVSRIDALSEGSASPGRPPSSSPPPSSGRTHEEPGEALPVQPFELEPVDGGFGPSERQIWGERQNGDTEPKG